jgi:hypothetical protein
MTEALKEYLVEVERDNDEVGRCYRTYDAYSSSEAQAYALDEAKPDELIVAVYVRVL